MSHHDAELGPILELDQIDGLVQAAGPEGAQDILEAFWRSTNDLIAGLRSQIAENNLDEAFRTAHAVKGSASNVGAARIAVVARSIEAACKADDVTSAHDRIEHLAASVAEARDAFSIHLRSAS